MRRGHRLRALISHPSGVIEDQVDRLAGASVLRKRRVELLASARCEPVFTHLPTGFGRRPGGLDPAVQQQLLQGWIERAFLDTQLLSGQQVNALRDGVAVERLSMEEAQDEYGERTRREADFSRHSLTMHIHESSTGVNRHRHPIKIRRLMLGVKSAQPELAEKSNGGTAYAGIRHWRRLSFPLLV